MSRSKIQHTATEAVANVTLVEIDRGEQGWLSPTRGFAVAQGAKWLAVQHVEASSWRLDGYVAVRIRDIVTLGPWVGRTKANFPTRALRYLDEDKPTPLDNIDCDSTRRLIDSVAKQFEFLGISYRGDEPSGYWVGRPVSVGKKAVELLTIDSAGKWKKRPTTHRFRDLSDIGFGGRYLDTLTALQQPRRSE